MSEDKLHTTKGKTQRTRNTRRAPKKITRRHLHNVSLAYLSRYASSSENLKRVLMRRVEKSCRHHGGSADEFTSLVDELIERYKESGLLNDEAYARGVAVSQRRRGSSRRAIQAKLIQKGLTSEEIDTALQEADEQLLQEEGDEQGEHNAEMIAAMKFARRRRIGPYRQQDRKEFWQKDMAALARAGFSYETTRLLVDSDSEYEEDAPAGGLW